MPFSESLKKKIRKQSQGHCCICKNFPVEIHHIIPQAEGGSDNEDNAAPLCPNCHTTHGDNPKMRKQIRERRDDWLEHCRIQSAVTAKLDAISDSLQYLIGHIASRTTNSAPKLSENNMKQFLENCQYSFITKTCREIRHMMRQIRERRDDWLEHCRIQSAVTAKLDAISDSLQYLIGHIASRTTNSAPKLSENNMKQFLENCQYSFIREKLIHPLIVRELLGWISDRRETIVSVDLKSANRSNRFYGDFSVHRRDDRLWVKWEDDDREFFEYSHIATSPTGVEIVECYDCGGGSGVFGSIGLFCLEYDRALEVDRKQNVSTCERAILKSLGSVGLGDRYKGTITYKDERLIVGPDIGCFNRGQHAAQKIPIQ